MKRLALFVGFVFFFFSITASAQVLKAWWVGMEAGVGQLKLTSDQASTDRASTFAFGFAGGHRLGQHARIGGQVNGWLLEASNFNDPTVGESVSTLLAIVDVFPVAKRGLFLRGGAGLAMYSNNHPGESSGGHGFGWTAGAGYEIPVTTNFFIVPTAMYSAGNLGDGYNLSGLQTGRSFSVVEFKAGLVWRFGG